VPKVEAPPPPPKPAVTNVAVACPNVRAIAGEIAYPSRAQKEGVYSGEVVIQFTLGANGEVVNPTVIKSSNRVFNNAALDGARLLKCVGGGKDTVVQWPIGFKVD
jgi:TonB family protein